MTRLVTVRTQELRDALEREKELKAQANETHERIERLQKSGIVGQLSSMIAHELRQPMSAALLFSKSARKILSREEPNTRLLTEVLGNIESQIERANSIIDNVRSYAKGIRKSRQKVDLKVIIDQSIAAFRSTGRYPKVDIFVETDPGVIFEANPLGTGDAQSCEKCLRGLSKYGTPDSARGARTSCHRQGASDCFGQRRDAQRGGF